jgi:hypothetical protein
VIEAGEVRAADGSMLNPDDPINTFTLMKVIGRDIWIGIWCLILAVVSVVFWERKDASQRAVGVGIIWERFPKFVLGFFAASIIMTWVTSTPPADWVGTAPWSGTFKSSAETIPYAADFTGFRVPEELDGIMAVDAADRTLSFANGGRPMTIRQYELLKTAVAGDLDRAAMIGAFKQLRFASDWFEYDLRKRVIPLEARRHRRRDGLRRRRHRPLLATFPKSSPPCPLPHHPRQPARGLVLHLRALRTLCDIWEKHGSGLTNMHGSTGDIIFLGTTTDELEPIFKPT